MPILYLPILEPHRADFIIWTEQGIPYGGAATERGVEVYGEAILRMLDHDPQLFFANVPDDVVIGVLTDDNGLQYASKNCLQ